MKDNYIYFIKRIYGGIRKKDFLLKNCLTPKFKIAIFVLFLINIVKPEIILEVTTIINEIILLHFFQL